MNKATLLLIIGVFIIAVLAGGVFFIQDNSEPRADIPTLMDDSLTADETMSGENSEPEESMVTREEKGYVAYSSEGYSSIENDRHVLFFYADWCPTCRPVDRELQERSGELPADLTVVRVNYNDTDTDSSEEALADQYGITYQHTFVLIEDGEVVTRWNGGGVDQLLSNVN